MSSEVASYIEKANEKFKENEPLEAIEYLDKAIELEQNNTKAIFLKGTGLVDLQEDEKALKCFDRVLELDPNYTDVYYNKSLVLLYLDDFEEAERYINKFLEFEPENINAIILKGLILAASDKKTVALSYFDDALNIDSNSFLALKNKGITLSELEKYKEAIESLKLALKLEPEDEDLLFYLGLSLACLNKFDEAINFYDKALNVNKHNSWVLYYKSCALADIGKEEDAIKCLDEILNFEPEFTNALTLKAELYRRLEKLDHALKCYKNVTEIDPENLDAWIGMGNVLKDIGKKEDSIRAYEKFIQVVKKNKRSDLDLQSKRVSEYLNWVKSGKTITFSPKEKPQYWQWSTRPEYFLEWDGSEKKSLEPNDSIYDPGSFWTCHKDTLAGDLILLYRAGKKNGREYMDIKYLMMARSDAYPLDDLDVEDGWNYGCDYIPLFKFKKSLKLSEMKAEPNLKGWNALGAKFHRKVYKTKDMYWKYLIDLLMKKNPDFAEFWNTFDRKKVIANIKTEKEFEDNLKENIHVLKKFGFDLKVESSQERCVGDEGYMDLLCRDKTNNDYVVIELKITKAHTSVFGQVSRYMGWVMDHKANGEAVKGIVISRGYDKKFQSALKTNPNIDHIELVDVVSELGMKLK
ncbi:endonuclease NucS domain-containing protein [Methanobacterium congolense]|uniref:TPR repeat-containing protein MJ1345 n=1 Tax=Methanobacterium congolense TaxID=118062 RepID=A0A1D3L140_9EURY|nr:endonuclease NucS domain-containing protein [Methanobacterium congolense]SCG85307.1 TPR repeat-containing protein MJ1345 [Methanobacterium congolense]